MSDIPLRGGSRSRSLAALAPVSESSGNQNNNTSRSRSAHPAGSVQGTSSRSRKNSASRAGDTPTASSASTTANAIILSSTPEENSASQTTAEESTASANTAESANIAQIASEPAFWELPFQKRYAMGQQNGARRLKNILELSKLDQIADGADTVHDYVCGVFKAITAGVVSTSRMPEVELAHVDRRYLIAYLHCGLEQVCYAVANTSAVYAGNTPLYTRAQWIHGIYSGWRGYGVGDAEDGVAKCRTSYHDVSHRDLVLRFIRVFDDIQKYIEVGPDGRLYTNDASHGNPLANNPNNVPRPHYTTEQRKVWNPSECQDLVEAFVSAVFHCRKSSRRHRLQDWVVARCGQSNFVPSIAVGLTAICRARTTLRELSAVPFTPYYQKLLQDIVPKYEDEEGFVLHLAESTQKTVDACSRMFSERAVPLFQDLFEDLKECGTLRGFPWTEEGDRDVAKAAVDLMALNTGIQVLSIQQSDNHVGAEDHDIHPAHRR